MTDWKRPIAGTLKYPSPPEPGTILGPMWTKEYLVVLGQNEDGRTVLGYAQPVELEAAVTRQRDEGKPARSITEIGRRST